jgi:hypothetical protein
MNASGARTLQTFKQLLHGDSGFVCVRDEDRPVAKRENSGSDCGINGSLKRASEDKNESVSTKDL